MADIDQPDKETEGSKPTLAVVLRVKEVTLKKKSEWGFVLRGTTTQYGSSLRIYTCRIDKVNQGGPADVSCSKREHVHSVNVFSFARYTVEPRYNVKPIVQQAGRMLSPVMYGFAFRSGEPLYGVYLLRVFTSPGSTPPTLSHD